MTIDIWKIITGATKQTTANETRKNPVDEVTCTRKPDVSRQSSPSGGIKLPITQDIKQEVFLSLSLILLF
jgi:hypothetical protein